MVDDVKQVVQVVRLLVDEPERVQVSERQRGNTTTFELRVAEDDLGKVIGRQGRTARALRTLLGSRGIKDGGSYELKVLD